MNKNIVILLGVVSVILGILVSGCMSSEQSGKYQNVSETSAGKVEISSNMPIMVMSLDELEDVSKMEKNIWYCSSDVTSRGQAVFFIGHFGKLSDVDINVKLPNGHVAYAKDFKLTQNEGEWQIEANHQNINLIAMSNKIDPRQDTKMWERDWNNNTYVVTEDIAQSQDIGVLLSM